MYPGKQAKTLDIVFSKSDDQHSQSVEGENISITKDKKVRVVFIDSTWNQTAKILMDPKIAALQKVQIDDRETIFWRYQTGKSKQHLATIEAIYYFLVDYHAKVLGQCYQGEYDELLFLYKFMYGKILELYDRSKLRSYNR